MYGVGCAIDYFSIRRKRTRLLAIEHYKSMFPERVPTKVETVYADVIQPWSPHR
uniref:Transposase n=1 Tax=Mesocestoides corti TaxID=53468 RepID=A0A5K3FX85_MESCO